MPAPCAGIFLHANYSPFDGRYGADGGPIHATYTPDCRPIRKAPAQPNATRPASTVHDLISSPRAFAGRAAPKERLVDSADVPAPRLTARGAQALLLVSRAVGPAMLVLVTVSTSRLSCKRAGKTRKLMPVWDSSGESRNETYPQGFISSPPASLSPRASLLWNS